MGLFSSLGLFLVIVKRNNTHLRNLKKADGNFPLISHVLPISAGNLYLGFTPIIPGSFKLGLKGWKGSVNGRKWERDRRVGHFGRERVNSRWALSFVLIAIYEFSDSLSEFQIELIILKKKKPEREEKELLNTFQIPGFFQIPQIFFFSFGVTTKWTQEHESSAFISWMFYSKNFQNFLYCIQILRQLSILLLLALEGRAVFIFKCGGAGSAAVKLGFSSQVSWVGVGAASLSADLLCWSWCPSSGQLHPPLPEDLAIHSKLLRIIGLRLLDSQEVKPVNSKGNQPWIFIGRTDAEADALVLRPPDAKSQLFGKDPHAGKDWRQKEKGVAEDEMVR